MLALAHLQAILVNRSDTLQHDIPLLALAGIYLQEDHEGLDSRTLRSHHDATKKMMIYDMTN